MLRKANLSLNARQLSKNIGKGEVVFDHAVQRGIVWDINRKSLLIHSMIEGYPIPAMYAARYENLSMLDGKQRCNCIYDYLNDKFALTNIPEITLEDGTEIDINGKKFSELPEELQDVISNYSLVVHYFEDITDDEVSELFFRINNGKPLSQIEISRTLSKSLSTIQQIGQHELFTATLTEKAFEKYTHEDLVIKSYIMLTFKEPCYDTKVVRPTMQSAIFTEENINDLNAIFDRILEVYKTIASDTSTETGKLSKKIAKRIITRTHMLSIIPIVKKSIEDGVSIELFTAWVKNFFCGSKSPTKYDKYNSKATSGSGHAESVKARLDVINKDYNKFMKKHENDVFEKAEEVVEVAETVTTIETVEETVVEEKEVEVIETIEDTETEIVSTTEENFIGITDEDDIPESIKAILEAAEDELEDASMDDVVGEIADSITDEIFAESI